MAALARGPGRLTFAPVLALALAFVLALAPACSFIQPETGDRLTACVDDDSDPLTPVSFAKDIRPLINGTVVGSKPCAKCHYGTAPSHEGLDASGFNLETLDLLRKGGRRTSGDVVVPGKPCSSSVIQKIRGTYEGARMPKGGPYLSPAQAQLWMDWIAEGAKGVGTE